jgi:regulator of RNase E activity RraA
MQLPGHRFHDPAPQVAPEVLAGFREAAVAVISDNLNRLHGTRNLRPVHGSKRLLGTAVTVKTRPGDNYVLHQSYDVLRPGDVLVVDGAGDLNQALVGEIMMQRAKLQGVAGFVIDGAVRDVGAFVAAEFPCFARGVTHRGPYKFGPGELNVPIAIDGMVVMPGDLIVGDEDGVIAFPPAVADELLSRVRAQEEREAGALKAIAEGRFDSTYVGVPSLPGRERR